MPERQLNRSCPPKGLSKTRYPCQRVDLGFVASARYRFVNAVDLSVTPEQLFEVLAEGDSWSRWATAISDVTWTSPEPHGVGTTRTVAMWGGIVSDAEFLAWECHSHMAFRLNQSTSKGLAAFVEDYRVQETPTGCHVSWTVAITPRGVATRVGMLIGRPVMARAFRRFAHNLQHYTDERFGMTNSVGVQR
ncbi:SRPBCC family protein [Mycolicibacterium sp. CBMA 226]|uniref:SRPBCC family protein n=1 Tax=Mycolicibacterium sp. CBMA 226 TaxID=2606611 RepID=UPI0012DFB237|nr:SRPBCC family protein [Mycolicibacterium sp. CBMA 226]MUL77018.1 SRPBCC family protein [Mycolicibacterium sp. CBMA 226]